jgi:hypothetical protein
VADDVPAPVILAVPAHASTAARTRSRVIIVWALLRLPLLALLIYGLRHPILNVIERWFDIFDITRFVIDLLSTPLMRLVSAGALFGALLLLAGCARRLRPVTAYAFFLLASSAVLVLFYKLTATSPRRGVLVALILWVNLAPIGSVRLLFPRVWTVLMVTGVALVEIFCVREYCRWLRERPADSPESGARHSILAGNVPGLVITSLGFAVLVSGGRLLAFEQMIRMPAEAHVIERGRSFNGIELDPAGAYLYATGHDVPYLRRYTVGDLSAPPLESSVSTGGAQGFAYDPRAKAIYAFNTFTHQLLFFDAATLEVRRVVALPELSPGDPWVVVDPVSDTLTLVSEADQKSGVPFIVLDRATGGVLAQEDLDAGNVLRHPIRPWLYLSFFRRRSQVILYDLQRKTATHAAPADSRAERMVFRAETNEVLVTSPMESRIMRFDADRLSPKGHIPAPFGARAIALDERRELLLCGNLATGHVVVMDVRTGRRLRSYYLGPWLRTIVLDVERGTAYVSANGALYRLAYAAPIRTSS